MKQDEQKKMQITILLNNDQSKQNQEQIIMYDMKCQKCGRIIGKFCKTKEGYFMDLKCGRCKVINQFSIKSPLQH